MKTLLRFFIITIAVLSAITATSQDKPRWASKGVGHLQEKRSNDTYTFVKFETFGSDLSQLRNESTRPLVDYLASHYGLDPTNATVSIVSPGITSSSLPNDPEGNTSIQRDYKVTFSGLPVERTFYARLVDEYVTFDENADMTYDYTLYGLYAVGSSEGTEPVYDEYTYTRSYNGKALVMSIVPGLGQLYKGQNTKAYCIWGGEALFAVATAWTEVRRNQYSKDRDKAIAAGDQISADSYDSKTTSWRTMRNIAIGGLVAVYAYNLADAAISKGGRQVVVSKKNDSRLTFGPRMVCDEFAALPAPAIGLTLSF